MKFHSHPPFYMSWMSKPQLSCSPRKGCGVCAPLCPHQPRATVQLLFHSHCSGLEDLILGPAGDDSSLAFGIFHFISGGSSLHCLTGGKIPGEDSEWEAWPRAGPASWEAPPRLHGAVSDCGVSLMQEPGARVCQRLLLPDLLTAANSVSLSTTGLNSCAMLLCSECLCSPKIPKS